MTRTKVLIIVAVALGVLLVGGWIAFLVLPAGAPPQAAQTTSSTTATSSSSEAQPTPEPRTALATAAPSVSASAVNSSAVSVASASRTAPVAAPAATATLVVDGTRYALRAPAGSTLEAAMQQLMAEGSFSYTAKTYSGLGSFVTEINGSAGGSGRYWIFYVNGEQSQTGISSTRVRSGDVIEWKLEKSY